MKETELREQDKIEIVKQTSIEKKTVFIGTAYPKKGHTMFEVNLKEKTIEVAEFDVPTTLEYNPNVTGVKKSVKKIIKKPDCIYVSALNKKNVDKILMRELNLKL